MARITVDINEEWLAVAQEALGTTTKVSTINAALESFYRRRKAEEAIAALDSAELDFTDAETAWRYGGGRNFNELVVKALEAEQASCAEAS